MPNWGLETDLIFNRVSGSAEVVGDFTVVRTPATPDYYYGNMLVLNAAPDNLDRARLEADFAKLVGSPPQIKHRTFSWAVEEGAPRPDVDGYIKDGYEFHESAVLLAGIEDLTPPLPPSPEMVIRPYRDDADWASWHELKMADKHLYPKAEYASFLRGQEVTYRTLIEAGHGDWWGAYIGGQEAAHLGLFFSGTLGRFQSVLTAHAYRNRGICRTLVHHVAMQGFVRAERLVMVADEYYHAVRIYESLGFKKRQRLAGLCWWPK